MLMIKRLMTLYVPGMLTCEEVDSFIYDFHEGQLSYTESLKFKLHLSMCRECRAYLRGYKKTINSVKTDFIRYTTVQDIPEELVQVILKSRKANTTH